MRRLVTELVAKELAAERERQEEARRERQSRIGEIMSSAGLPDPPPERARKRPRTPPEKRWLRVVPGLAAAGWLASRWWRRAIAGTATAAVLTAGGLSADLMAPAPAAQVPAHHRVHRHHGTVPAVVPSVTPPRKRRRKPQAAVSAAPPRPGQSGGPAPSPASTPGPVPALLPTPVPVPSVTAPVPLPTPLPTCLDLTGHHCHDHGGDIPAPLEGVTGNALRGVTGLS